MQNKLIWMYKVLLSIGTNTNTRFNLNRAKYLLQKDFPSIQFTCDTKSKAYGKIYKGLFMNTLGYFESDLHKNDLISHFKNIEKIMGRSPEDKAEGKVIIDIDLIKWDNEIVKPNDFERSYVQDLMQFVK